MPELRGLLVVFKAVSSLAPKRKADTFDDVNLWLRENVREGLNVE